METSEYYAISYQSRATTPDSSRPIFKWLVMPKLVALWLNDYERTTTATRIVETNIDDFSYLFDIEQERLIAAWGFSKGRNAEIRDKSRMARHPKSEDSQYHRGHAVAHCLGGGTDINIVPQLGCVNVKDFRALERKAVQNPGALYFTYWMYAPESGQKPTSVHQGLLLPGEWPDIRAHRN